MLVHYLPEEVRTNDVMRVSRRGKKWLGKRGYGYCGGAVAIERPETFGHCCRLEKGNVTGFLEKD